MSEVLNSLRGNLNTQLPQIAVHVPANTSIRVCDMNGLDNKPNGINMIQRSGSEAEILYFTVPYFGPWNVQCNSGQLSGTLSPITIYTFEPYHVIMKPLEDATWSEIDIASRGGQAYSIWKIGDSKSVSVNGRNNYAEIVDFSHDDLSYPSYTGGRSKAGITFCFRYCLNTSSESFDQTSYGNGKNGYPGSRIYNILNQYAESSTLLPSDLRRFIKPVDKLSLVPILDGNGTFIDVICRQKLWLFSSYEITGKELRSGFVRHEGNYYKDYFTKASNVPGYKDQDNTYKHKLDDDGSPGLAVMWWCRDIVVSGTTCYAGCMGNSGVMGNASMAASNYLVAGFCV